MQTERHRPSESVQQDKYLSGSITEVLTHCPRNPIKVFIVDRHPIIRMGIRAALATGQDLELVGESDTLDGLLAQTKHAKPDVVLLDAGLVKEAMTEETKKSFEAIPLSRVILLMGENNSAAFRQAVENGVQGYLSNSSSHQELFLAIKTVARGGSYLGAEASGQTLSLLRLHRETRPSHPGLGNLSPQERQVIILMAEGKTNKEIATSLALSDKTVKNYIANMFTKLEIDRRTQAVALYVKEQAVALYVREQAVGHDSVQLANAV